MVQKLPEKILDQIRGSIPKRRLASVDEIAETALFISRDIPSLTGETIAVNGGHYMYQHVYGEIEMNHSSMESLMMKNFSYFIN